MMRFKVWVVWLAWGLFAAAQADEAKAPWARDLGNDHFVFSGTVRVDKPVAGDLIAAGGTIDVEAPVAGDAVLMGGNLRLGAGVGQNVYAAGGRLAVDAAVGRNLRVAGGQVDLWPKASVAGNISVAGGQVSVRAPVKGSVQMAGGKVLIDAAIGGDVVVSAGQLELGPNARLAGSLRYRGRDEIKRDPAATVAGVIERLALPGAAASGPDARRHERRGPRLPGAGWLWTLGLMLITAALVLAAPAASQRVAQTLGARPGWSLLLGFIALVCIPVASLILMVSIVGIPLALLLLLLYLALLLVGYAASALALGHWALARFKADALGRSRWRIGAALLALLVLALLGALPYVGGWVALIAVLAGIGAIALQVAPGAATPAASGPTAAAS